jgi:3-methyladenine DNA glycosylase AlkD
MTLDQILAVLEQNGNPIRKKKMIREGAGECYGVTLGVLRSLARECGKNTALAMDLWETKNDDARMLASMTFNPEDAELEALKTMVEQVNLASLLDEFVVDVVVNTEFSEKLMLEWMDATRPLTQRAAWDIALAGITAQSSGDPDQDFTSRLEPLLSLIETRLPLTPEPAKEAMNRALCEIGVRYTEYTDRCVGLGEKLGVYRDKKVPKGCVSPYAPEWIAAGVKKRKVKKSLPTVKRA